MIDRDPITTWSQNRITLLGDAARTRCSSISRNPRTRRADMVTAHDQFADAFAAYEAIRVPAVRTVSRRPRGGSARWCTSTGR